MKNIQISPSILSADFSQLGSEIKRLEEGGADTVSYTHLTLPTKA